MKHKFRKRIPDTSIFLTTTADPENDCVLCYGLFIKDKLPFIASVTIKGIAGGGEQIPIVLPFKDYTASAKTAARNTKNLSDQLYSRTINRIVNAQFVNLMCTKITGAVTHLGLLFTVALQIQTSIRF